MRLVEDPGAPVAGAARGARRAPASALTRWLARPWPPAALLVGVTGLGLGLRLAALGQDLFADELSTFWIVSTHGLGGVVSTVHTDAEITPPLYFVLAWLSTRVDLTPELLRLPSLVAGVALVPLTYLLGARTVGRAAALVAAVLTALSPFMIFYSTEARGYELAVLFVVLSTLALLAAVDSGRARWWVAYAACSAAAAYSHYTAVFALGAQLLWLLWAHPGARRPARLANLGALAAYLPWLSGLRADLESPTTDILSTLSPFTAHNVSRNVAHWAVGYPYRFRNTGLAEMPGRAALVLLVLALGAALAGLVLGGVRQRFRRALPGLDSRVLLVVAVALSTPVGTALASAIGTNVLSARNLAASWPGLALLLGALVVAAGPRLRLLAVALLIGSFAIGAARMMEDRFRSPDYGRVAQLVDRRAGARDLVVDASAVGVSPGPFTGLDVRLEHPHRIVRLGTPQERSRPFAFAPIAPVEAVSRRVAGAAAPHIFIVSSDMPTTSGPRQNPLTGQLIQRLRGRYRRVQARTFNGSLNLYLLVYADRSAADR